MLEIALSLYDGVIRRGREDYKKHPLRMSDIAQETGWFDYRLHLLICLHDVLEVVEGLSMETLIEEFNLSSEEVEVLDILTAKEGESSEEHFNRVLNSNNVLALKVKYCDNIDNAHMEYADVDWYKTVLGKDWMQESNKYIERAGKIVQVLDNLI